MKKVAGILFLGAAAAVCIALYGSMHELYRARAKDMEPEAKLNALSRAAALDPLNGMAYGETGVTHLDRASENLGDIPRVQADVDQAYRNLQKALRLDPGSAFAHFYYAKTLTLMKFIGRPVEDRPFRELEKAARLGGSHLQLDREIGVTLLGLWDSLSGEERVFAQDLLRLSLLKDDVATFEEVLHLWDLNVHDYAIMDGLLPDSPRLLRIYAQFLGDKNMPLAERHKALARAERLDYEEALKDDEEAQNLIKLGRLGDAAQRLALCLSRLKGIRFYSQLAGGSEAGAEMEKKALLWKAATLELAKAKLDESRSLETALDPLRTFLVLEDDYNSIKDLESYLKDLRIVPEIADNLPLNDIRRLSFEVQLMFKLHKYRQIIGLGSQLQRSLIMPDEKSKADLSGIFLLVGDSYLKLDFIYESEAFYQKAVELTPGNIEALSRLKLYYERRNEPDKVREVDRRLGGLVKTGQVLSQPRLLAKSTAFVQPVWLYSDQTRLRLEFEFAKLPGNSQPLITVLLNDRVRWEGYVKERGLSLDLDGQAGANDLQVIAVNGPVALKSLILNPLETSGARIGARSLFFPQIN
jgi:tetratricopeptide (TPR) repeat protein